MSFLTKFVKKAAPKIVAATTIGGSSAERNILKSAVSSPVFEPVFDKFAKQVETIGKIGVGVAGAAVAGPLIASGAALTQAKNMGFLKNLLPAAKDIDWSNVLTKGFELAKGALNKGGGSPSNTPPPAASEFDIKSVPWWLYALAGVLLFWKQIKKLFR